MDESKQLELAIAQIERQFGTGSVMRLGSSQFEKWPAIPTGALSLDKVLGIGGLPKGRVVEIFGPESSGKSTLANVDTYRCCILQRHTTWGSFWVAEHYTNFTS